MAQVIGSAFPTTPPAGVLNWNATVELGTAIVGVMVAADRSVIYAVKTFGAEPAKTNGKLNVHAVVPLADVVLPHRSSILKKHALPTVR